MNARREENLKLSIFADALRNFLGLEPLYQSGVRPDDSELARFYRTPFSEGSDRTPKRGSLS